MSMGFVKDGQYIKAAGNLSMLNTPVASETTNGLMSYEDKKKVDAMLTAQDLATEEDIINGVFG